MRLFFLHFLFDFEKVISNLKEERRKNSLFLKNYNKILKYNMHYKMINIIFLFCDLSLCNCQNIYYLNIS